jgi:hypothetical protein
MESIQQARRVLIYSDMSHDTEVPLVLLNTYFPYTHKVTYLLHLNTIYKLIQTVLNKPGQNELPLCHIKLHSQILCS